MKDRLVTIIKLATSFGLMWGLGYLAHQQFPWWITSVVAAGVCFFVPIKNIQSFAMGTLAFSILWGMQAYNLSAMNMDLLATKMGELLGGFKPIELVYATSLMGGFLGGFGAMTGSSLRQIFFPMGKKEKAIVQNSTMAKEIVS
ncbi:MAG: hypothetical protein AB8G86_09940 [Saprospiraceae bacterium]